MICVISLASGEQSSCVGDELPNSQYEACSHSCLSFSRWPIGPIGRARQIMPKEALVPLSGTNEGGSRPSRALQSPILREQVEGACHFCMLFRFRIYKLPTLVMPVTSQYNPSEPVTTYHSKRAGAQALRSQPAKAGPPDAVCASCSGGFKESSGFRPFHSFNEAKQSRHGLVASMCRHLAGSSSRRCFCSVRSDMS